MNWAVGNWLRLTNTCFKKRKKQLITFRSGEVETVIDNILVSSKHSSRVNDVKVIPDNKVVSHHYHLTMVCCSINKSKGRKSSEKILERQRLKESEIKELFAEKVNKL